MSVRFGPWPGRKFIPGEVHLGWLRVEAAATRLEGLLTPDERTRASAFKFDEDRTRYVVRRGTLRLLLAHYLGLRPAELAIGENHHGKPELASGDIEFNVSHSRDLIVFGFAVDRVVGVDVEGIDESRPVDEMARRVLSPAEKQHFSTLSGADRHRYFFVTWARKEAYVKGVGEGLSIAPESFSVLGESDPMLVDDPGRPGTWATTLIDLDDAYATAAAAEGNGWSVRVFDVAEVVG